MQVPEIMKGAEPFYAVGGKVGILVSHGFTGTPQSMRFLAEGLARAGYTVALPRLKGHGTTPADMAEATAADWVHDIQEALDWLAERCTTLFMTGLSMGGTLTLWAAGQYPNRFAGVIPINAAVRLGDPGLASLALDPGAPPELPGIGGDIKAKDVKELAYPVTPVPAIKHVLLLITVAYELLPRITCPALVIQSRGDHVVPPVSADLIYNRVASKEKRLLWLEDSYHVATLDNDKEKILDAILTFVWAHSPSEITITRK